MKVIIVGAGISGLCTAWALAARGHEVTLVEQGPVPNPLSASGDHHRIIRRAYGADTGYGHAITDAYAAWERLWADLGARHYDPRGFLLVSREPGDEAEIYRGGLDAGGYAYETLDPGEAARRFPFLDPGTFRYACLSAEGGALHCRRIATGIAAWLAARGARVMEHAKVAGVDAASGAVRLAGGETLRADRVVVTAGAWVLRLFPELRVRLATWRTAVVYLAPPADLEPVWARAPVILDVGGETDGYVIPPSGGAGLKFGSGLTKRPTDDPDADRQAGPGEGERIRDLFSPPFARIADYRVADTVTCAYTFTADERFFASQEWRCVVVSACSGHGYKFGAAVGGWTADYVEDGDFAKFGRRLRAETE